MGAVGTIVHTNVLAVKPERIQKRNVDLEARQSYATVRPHLKTKQNKQKPLHNSPLKNKQKNPKQTHNNTKTPNKQNKTQVKKLLRKQLKD